MHELRQELVKAFGDICLDRRFRSQTKQRETEFVTAAMVPN